MCLRFIVLSVFVLLSISENSYSADCDEFTDADDYKGAYANDVESLRSKGLISGYDNCSFRYENTLSRREMMKLVVLAMKNDDETVEEYKSRISLSSKRDDCFTDVHEDEFASDYICYAKEIGVVDGYKDGSFRVKEKITYDQASKMILLSLSGGKKCWKSYGSDSLVYYAEYMNSILKKDTDSSALVKRDFFAHMLNNAIKEENKSFITSCSDDNELLAKYSPLMSFYKDDKTPVPIDSFISHSILYTTYYTEELSQKNGLPKTIIGYGVKLPVSLSVSVKVLGIETSSSNVKPLESERIGESKSPDLPVPEYAVLENTFFLDFRNGIHGGVDYKPKVDPLEFEFDKKISFSSYDVTRDSEKTIYGRVVRESGKIYLQYFFFYLMNDWNSYNARGVGFHEGDWEGIVIELDNDQSPLRMGVSIHGKYKYSATRSWGNVIKISKKGADPIGTNPLVYIGHGGHPTYFESGVFPHPLGLTDDHNGTGRILYHKESEVDGSNFNSEAEKTAYSIVNIEENASTKSWFISDIYWGQDYEDIEGLQGKSVASPGSIYSHDPERWSDPKTWLDKNKGDGK
ncbi:MAG: S-layer homology domain-containing protein [Candidatus Electrothrix scaldis]|nr:MAG: S-layer homology domain-containing protein [Candidatus Electrothrix sp. GW3-3]